MGRLRQFRRNAFLKNLSDSRANGSFQLVPFIFLAYIPGIHVLAGHNAVDANVPHHRRAVPTGFELVIDLLLLVGTLNGRAAFVNQPPLLRPASGSGKQAKIIAAVCMVCPPVFGIGVPPQVKEHLHLRRSWCFLIRVTHHPCDKTVHSARCSRRRFLSFLPFLWFLLR